MRGRTQNRELRTQEKPIRRDRQGARLALLAALVLAPSFTIAQEDVEYYEPEAVREAAAEVLSGPEFRHLERLDDGAEATSAGEKVEPPKPVEPVAPAWTIPGLDFVSSLIGGTVQVAFLAVLAAALVGLVVLIARGLRGAAWRRAKEAPAETDVAEDEPEPLVTPGERPPDVYLEQARAAATAGRFDEALALLLLGAMGHAERAGLIRPRRGLTYRDYLRALPDASAWRPALDRLIRLYAPVGFGRRAATAEAFAEAVGPYEAALAAEPVGALPDGRG